jgi:membrane-bound metal-dependent hydrolase YbcI (DUF457 family)
MEPVTHLLASYTLARAARSPVISPRMAIFLCAGLAPDLDWFFHLPAPLSALRAYGSMTHSLLVAGALGIAIGLAGWTVARRFEREKISLGAALVAGMAATALHLLLDLCSNTGITLYWPFHVGRTAWNLATAFDANLLLLLAACALLPALFSLVTEEIGAGRDAQPSRAWPLAALLLGAAYLGGRAFLHGRAEELLGAVQFQGSSPRRWAAYPVGASPFGWRGVVETDSLLAEVEVSVVGGTALDPRRAALHFKPEPSPTLDAAAASPLARAYTSLARFPSASIEQQAEGTRVELRELGDSPLRSARGAWLAAIEVSAQSGIGRQDFYFLPWRSP